MAGVCRGSDCTSMRQRAFAFALGVGHRIGHRWRHIHGDAVHRIAILRAPSPQALQVCIVPGTQARIGEHAIRRGHLLHALQHRRVGGMAVGMELRRQR
jgi:hypothetical protein